jgi:glycosyltransferase involved in cell wall biosynthesis
LVTFLKEYIDPPDLIRFVMENSPLVSVIIPAVNEAASLPRALNHFRAESVPHEIIVAVGPSYDGTASLAEAGGCVVVESLHRHRARQMNLGAGRRASFSPR